MAARKGSGGKGGRKGRGSSPGSTKGGAGFSPGGGKMVEKTSKHSTVKPKGNATGPTNADGGRQK